ncbi:hypothetical protein FRC10_011644 [Ceratobasidium sp. 414]|nr:hypothetical protein FRC10_011644 [Ceratobasidium sp. 414]
MFDNVKTKCPSLVSLLAALTGDGIEDESDNGPDSDEEQDEEGMLEYLPPPKKHPHFAIVQQISALAFRLNSTRNTLPKVLGMYMHAKHTSKSVFYLLQQSAITPLTNPPL